LGLNNEHPVPARRRRLLDRVASIDKDVDRRVGTDGPLGDGDVVRDGRREVNHRDLERLVPLPRLVELVQRNHALESTDNQERVDLVLLELLCDALHVGIGQGTVRTELGTTAGTPLVDAEPGELGDVAFEETDETVVNRDGSVAVAETVADGGTGGGVDSSSGSTGAEEEDESGSEEDEAGLERRTG
jgi:hypothetical protein